MNYALTVLPDIYIIEACTGHDTAKAAAESLDTSQAALAREIKHRTLGSYAYIRKIHGLQSRRPLPVPATLSPAFLAAIADGRITRGGRNLGTDLRAPLPGVAS